ncbi:MAG: threonine-phosphate decarboxylase CobD [Thermosediminibacteraceae bacterium]|nr:threonine-phosphate decarboxylase CobD [Thermosediminibacteraceae bacterium]
MKTRSHGGNIYEISKKCGLNYKEILDFSANINPLGFPNSVREIIKRKIDDIIYYPDSGQKEIKEAAAFYYGVKEENVLPGNGSVELINLIIEALRPTKVIIPSPTFTEYALASQSRRIRVELLDMTKNDFNWDDALIEAIKKRICPGALVVICNPNNPTGHLIKKDIIKVLIAETEKKKAFLLLDEAFMDFVGEDESSCTEVVHRSNFIVLRSLTKFFALPGLRIGFALTNKELINEIEKLKDPWNVNTFAAAVGKAVLKDRAYIEKTREYIFREKEFLWNGLKQFYCFQPFRPAANFIFVKITAEFKTSFLAGELLKRGIVIRECTDFAFLDDTYFRVAVKNRRANETLLETLREITASNLLGEEGR